MGRGARPALVGMAVLVVSLTFAAGRAAAVTPSAVWDGGGDGTHFADAANWAGDVLPTAGDRIDIGAAQCPNRATHLVNDLPDGFVVGGIDDHVAGHICTIDGDSIVLTGDVDADLVAVNAPLALSGDLTLARGRLEASDFDLAGHTLTSGSSFSGRVRDSQATGAVIVNGGGFQATGVGNIPVTAIGATTKSLA